MYAIIDSGGKQYKVEEGQRLSLEHLAGDVGDQVVFDRVLFVGGDDAKVGSPLVDGVTVEGTIEEHGRRAKIVVFKFKRRKMYRRRRGHRQHETVVRIDSIGGGAKPARKASRKKSATKPEPTPESAPQPESEEATPGQAEE